MMQSVGSQYDSILFVFHSSSTHSCPDCIRPVVLINRTKTLLRFGFAIIVACTILDSFLLPYLGDRYARSVWYPADPAKPETPSTNINFDLLYATEARRIPSSTQSKVCTPCARASVRRRTRQGLSAVASVIYGGLWYSSVQ